MSQGEYRGGYWYPRTLVLGGKDKDKFLKDLDNLKYSKKKEKFLKECDKAYKEVKMEETKQNKKKMGRPKKVIIVDKKEERNCESEVEALLSIAKKIVKMEDEIQHLKDEFYNRVVI